MSEENQKNLYSEWPFHRRSLKLRNFTIKSRRANLLVRMCGLFRNTTYTTLISYNGSTEVSEGIRYELYTSTVLLLTGGHAAAQLVEAPRYKPEVRGFDSRWCHWKFSLT